jgi:hypothetical protein
MSEHLSAGYTTSMSLVTLLIVILVVFLILALVGRVR